MRLLRERAGLEQRTLAHRAAMSERKLRYIERGERNPLAPDIVALYEVLIERLPDLSLWWLLTGSAEPAGGRVRAAVERREFNRRAAVVLGTLAFPLAADWDRTAVPTHARLDDALLDVYEQATEHYAKARPTLPPHELLPQVQVHLAGLNSRVGEDGGPDGLRRRLLSITAGSEALAGWLCFMMERRADARAHLEHAEPLAREVGDSDTLALILMLRSDLMSPVPTGGQGGFPEQARDRLAEALSVVSDGTPLPILAPLLLRTAEEAAFVGDEDAALAHLETAGRAVDTVDRRHYLRPTWGQAPDVGRVVRSFEGNIHQMLGRTGEAIRLLEPALTSRFPADQPITLIDLASAHAKEGDLGRAVELLGNAADLVAEHGLPVAGRRLVGVRNQQLARWNGDPTLRELDERIALL